MRLFMYILWDFFFFFLLRWERLNHFRLLMLLWWSFQSNWLFLYKLFFFKLFLLKLLLFKLFLFKLFLLKLFLLLRYSFSGLNLDLDNWLELHVTVLISWVWELIHCLDWWERGLRLHFWHQCLHLSKYLSMVFRLVCNIFLSFTQDFFLKKSWFWLKMFLFHL